MAKCQSKSTNDPAQTQGVKTSKNIREQILAAGCTVSDREQQLELDEEFKQFKAKVDEARASYQKLLEWEKSSEIVYFQATKVDLMMASLTALYAVDALWNT